MALQTVIPARQQADRLVNRMAKTMVTIAAERGHCLDLDLIDAGFEPSESHDYAKAARAVAARQQ